MNLQVTNQTKGEIFNSVKTFLLENEFIITKTDDSRPWGGFFVIDELQAAKFKKKFFANALKNKSNENKKISPKILIVESNKRLSWQYHHRRSEIWKIIGGKAAIMRSPTDEEGNTEIKKINDLIYLSQGERHRLIGLDTWGVIAEMWEHTDPDNLSDEDDIVRVQDDFGR